MSRDDRLLGVLARLVFVAVKPGALALAIQLDADGGQALAQIFLLGMLVMALGTTNAHRPFYLARFEPPAAPGTAQARHLLTYVATLGAQGAVVLGALILLAPGLAWGFGVQITAMALVFGIAEKISDEYVRFRQYDLDNRGLLAWALIKAGATLAAGVLALVAGIDMALGFPLLLLVLMLWGGRGMLRRIPRPHAKAALRALWADRYQVVRVFLSILILNLDKWLVQGLAPDALPLYMLFAQLAAGLLMAQNLFLLAPARAALVSTSPFALRRLMAGSLVLAGLGAGAAVILPLTNVALLSALPFAIVALHVLAAPFFDRIYWIRPDLQRMAIEAGTLGGAAVLMAATWGALGPEGAVLLFGLCLLGRLGLLIAADRTALRSRDS